MAMFAFSWAGMSGERNVQSRRRSLAMLMLILAKVSSQRLLNTKQRKTSIASAFSSFQLILFPWNGTARRGIWTMPGFVAAACLWAAAPSKAPYAE